MSDELIKEEKLNAEEDAEEQDISSLDGEKKVKKNNIYVIGVALVFLLAIIFLLTFFFWEPVKQVGNAPVAVLQESNRSKENISGAADLDKELGSGVKKQILSNLLLTQYQVKLALLKAQYEGNPQQALELLSQAQVQLNNVHGEKVHLLKKQLMEAMNEYQMQPVLDSGAILQKIDLIKKVLQVFVVNKKEAPTPIVWQTNSKSTSLWASTWSEIKKNFSNLIQVSRVPNKVDGAQIFKQWDLFIEIEQLKLAVLTGDNQAFKNQLKVLKEQVANCCQERKTEKEQALDAIKKLQTINIKPIVPNLSLVLQNLSVLITEQAGLTLEEDSN